MVAIYSLHHSSIGKSTQQQPFTAAAHIKYICRDSAVSAVLSARMPASRGKAMGYLRNVETASRKNARIADKILLALPKELNQSQRSKLVAGFANGVTKGRAPWFAAIHDKGKDQQNPHCHLVISDRDPDTGKRVAKLSEVGSTKMLRVLWQDYANRALEAAGRNERIDHRTLAAQGIRRKATIHIGVRASELARSRRRVTSRNRLVRNHCQAKSGTRAVNYPAIDVGKMRLAHNIEVRRGNLLKSREVGTEQEYWQAIDEDAFVRDINTLKRLHAVLERSDDGRSLMRGRDERMRGDFDRDR